MDDIKIKKLLGQRIKQLRKQKKLTQSALGELTDIDQRQIAYIEGGNCFPSLKTFNKLAKVFDCNIRDLFDYEHLTVQKNIKEKIFDNVQSFDEKKLKLCYEIIKVIGNS